MVRTRRGQVVRKSSEFQPTDPSARAHFRQISSFLAHVAKEIDPVQPFLLSKAVELHSPDSFAFKDAFNPMRRKMLLTVE